MRCIYCTGDTKVVNSRLQRRLNQIWRRRTCSKCGAVFTSLESVDFATSLLITQHGQRQPSQFVRDRLFISIYESCKHRPDAISAATALTLTTISKLLPKIKNASIDRDILVKTTAEVLKRFDKVAAVHYQAYHPLR